MLCLFVRGSLESSQRVCAYLYLNLVQRPDFYSYVRCSRFINILLLLYSVVLCVAVSWVACAVVWGGGGGGGGGGLHVLNGLASEELATK